MNGSPCCSGRSRSAIWRSHSGSESSPDGEVGDDDRIAFLDVKGDVDALGLPPDGGVHLGVGIAGPAIEHDDADHVAAEFLLVEVALLAEPEPAEEEGAGEPTGVGGADGAGEDLAGDRLVPLEGETPHHALGLLRRKRRGEEELREQRANHRDGSPHPHSGLVDGML